MILSSSLVAATIEWTYLWHQVWQRIQIESFLEWFNESNHFIPSMCFEFGSPTFFGPAFLVPSLNNACTRIAPSLPPSSLRLCRCLVQLDIQFILSTRSLHTKPLRMFWILRICGQGLLVYSSVGWLKSTVYHRRWWKDGAESAYMWCFNVTKAT